MRTLALILLPLAALLATSCTCSGDPAQPEVEAPPAPEPVEKSAKGKGGKGKAGKGGKSGKSDPIASRRVQNSYFLKGATAEDSEAIRTEISSIVAAMGGAGEWKPGPCIALRHFDTADSALRKNGQEYRSQVSYKGGECGEGESRASHVAVASFDTPAEVRTAGKPLMGKPKGGEGKKDYRAAVSERASVPEGDLEDKLLIELMFAKESAATEPVTVAADSPLGSLFGGITLAPLCDRDTELRHWSLEVTPNPEAKGTLPRRVDFAALVDPKSGKTLAATATFRTSAAHAEKAEAFSSTLEGGLKEGGHLAETAFSLTDWYYTCP